ncbi:MAG: purine-nucleoside phosphorylase [Candidatus Cloacimonas sp. 4484_209]|nr:MAG: purine-nucleoside phosphorylase [Candidatus Cloacimonas sp. 4484_209]
MNKQYEYDRIIEAVGSIKNIVDYKPEIAIILGTGLGALADDIETEKVVPYENIPYFPVSTVETHKGKLIFGMLSGKRIVAMQGRFHFYEGYSMKEITFPVRVMKFLGSDILIVSNACGSVNPHYRPGDIMAITDHINLLGDNPLRGRNDERLGPRFPDMYEVYDPKLIDIAEEIALKEGIRFKKGVYVALAGPNLETGAEYRMLRIIGGDVVGMSTVPEVIVARHMGMRVLGLSVITDMGLADAMKPVSLEDVIEVASRTEPFLTLLIKSVVERI